MSNSKTKSVVLKQFSQLLELKYSGTTPELYTYHVKLFLDHAANVPARVNNEDILNYNISIRNTSHSFRNQSINAIKAFFKLYLRKQVKEFASIRPPVKRRQVKVFDYVGLVKKINAVTNLKHRLILSLGLGAWLRVGETLNIKLEDLDSQLMTIHIANAKGNKSRTVQISSPLMDLVIEYYRDYRPNVYLFNGQKKPKYSSSSVGKIVDKYLGKKYRYHDLRSAGAAYAHENGLSLFDLSERLGHAKIETSKYYIPINQNQVPSLL